MDAILDWAFRALLGALLIVAGIVWNDLKKKVDDAVSWDDFNRQCNQIDKAQGELKQTLANINTKTDTLVESVARIEGKLGI
jgi:hypothetical protein